MKEKLIQEICESSDLNCYIRH